MQHATTATTATTAVRHNNIINNSNGRLAQRRLERDSLTHSLARPLIHSPTTAGSLNVDLNEISTNLVPFPRLHYLVRAWSVKTPVLVDTCVLANTRDFLRVASACGVVSTLSHRCVVWSWCGSLPEIIVWWSWYGRYSSGAERGGGEGGSSSNMKKTKSWCEYLVLLWSGIVLLCNVRAFFSFFIFCLPATQHTLDNITGPSAPISRE